MEFCPTCGNILRYERRAGGSKDYSARHAHTLLLSREGCTSLVEIRKKKLLVKKPVDAVVTKEDIPKGDETEAACPRCDHNRAYFKSMHIRSVDEPESRFYRCLKCEFTWREE